MHGDADVRPDLEEQVPCDPLQQSGVERRGQDGTVPHHEQVRLRAFRQLAPVVEEDRLVGALAHRLLGRQDVVQQVVRLDDGVDAAGVVAQNARDHQPHAVSVHALRRLPVGARDDDDGRRPAHGGVVAEVADPAGDEHPERHLAPRVDVPHGVAQTRLELGVRRRHRQRQARGRGAQPGEVPVGQEGPPVVGAQGLVDAVAVEEAVVEDGDHRPVAGRDHAVHVHGGLGDAGGGGGGRVDGVRFHAVHGTITCGNPGGRLRGTTARPRHPVQPARAPARPTARAVIRHRDREPRVRGRAGRRMSDGALAETPRRSGRARPPWPGHACGQSRMSAGHDEVSCGGIGCGC